MRPINLPTPTVKGEAAKRLIRKLAGELRNKDPDSFAYKLQADALEHQYLADERVGLKEG